MRLCLNKLIGSYEMVRKVNISGGVALIIFNVMGN